MIVWCTKLLPIRNLREGSNHIGFIVCSLILHRKRLISQLEPMTTRSHDDNFTIASRLPFIGYCNFLDKLSSSRSVYNKSEKRTMISLFVIVEVLKGNSLE